MNLLHVPLFVRADSPENLVKAMIQTNLDNQVTYKYFSVVFDGKNYTAWYLGDATLLVKQSPLTSSNDSLKEQNGRPKKITTR